ncbi:MAG TPA: PDGLE domain-containing protein [Dehalococcoidales bacterium]|nr:MAG: hypothetical protein A2Z05_06580 [Chloroflexi bacterium RBG_16_60_22]HJX13362.1 PDGLE domain-containing protein [Dehalococcoidales bacterium]
MKWWHFALIIPVLVAVVSPLASSSPDGLEKVAQDQGFLGRSQPAPFQVIADYLFPGIASEALATILAGLLGTLLLFGAVYGLAWLIKSRRTEGTGQGR